MLVARLDRTDGFVASLLGGGFGFVRRQCLLERVELLALSPFLRLAVLLEVSKLFREVVRVERAVDEDRLSLGDGRLHAVLGDLVVEHGSEVGFMQPDLEVHRVRVRQVREVGHQMPRRVAGVQVAFEQFPPRALDHAGLVGERSKNQERKRRRLTGSVDDHGDDFGLESPAALRREVVCPVVSIALAPPASGVAVRRRRSGSLLLLPSAPGTG
ncbi:hypothetical protein ET445_03755 [Agromyces protaetiae]|uniref:Uncharacterized protein n=1 Tax=Agromyces protaetiae TaxID=2509455 RepID=A0A4V0YGW1_9MICO|nr:hypothetical protein [Agromyces protaetiae]QAY72591.1 hypothetical protein ET445_03755 [Agromyces protaetiae]